MNNNTQQTAEEKENRRFKIVSNSLSEMVDLWERFSQSLPILKNESAYRKAKNISLVIKSAPNDSSANTSKADVISEIEKEIESLSNRKSEILTDYSNEKSENIQNILAAQNMEISMIVKFLKSIISNHKQ